MATRAPTIQLPPDAYELLLRDAAYVALAQSLGAELWTLDGVLARNAAGAALPVRLLEPA